MLKSHDMHMMHRKYTRNRAALRHADTHVGTYHAAWQRAVKRRRGGG
jgi:hypothetical protein